MPTYSKRKNGWQAKIRLAGHPPMSQLFLTKGLAQGWAQETEKLMRESKLGIVRGTLEDAIQRYIRDVCPTHRAGENEAKRLNALSRMLPINRQLKEITAADLSKFRDTRLESVSVATVRKEMTIIRSMLESARRDWSMIAVNPISDVKRPPAPPHRKRLLRDDETRRILLALNYEGEVATINQQVAVALLLALETAMRAGEVIGLTWGRVSLPGCYVSLEKTKNGDQRDVPLSSKAVELLESMRAVDSRNVFTLTSASLDALFRKARDRCEIKNLHFHDSRATALTNLSARLDVLELARMAGIRDPKTLMIYYRKSATDLAKKLG